MNEELKKLKESAKKLIDGLTSLDGLRQAELKFFGRKKGEFTALSSQIKQLSDDAKKEFGRLMNETRTEIENFFLLKEQELQKHTFKDQMEKERIDITEPLISKKSIGHAHPISRTRDELEDIFTSMGFLVYDGPQLESDYYNFEALNIPKDHPARDNQDTFYIKGHLDWCLRTHTSPEVQVRAQHDFKKPLRVITTGRCFRNEATDTSHEHTFHQIDGALIDKDISISHLKATLLEMFKRYFGKDDVEVRLRPGYFPFVEPGFEMDMSCVFCNKVGCRVCKYTGWVEMLGCGCMHPNVIRHAGFDPEVYSGFAFGMGIDRITMLKYGIDEIRWLQSGDLRFLEQF